VIETVFLCRENKKHKNVKHKAHQNIIGIVYDFDGTLSPNNMQEDTIFRAYKINKNQLWAKCDRLIRRHGYERTLAYLKTLLHDEVFREKPLEKEYLKRLACHIKYFPGVLSYFGHIKKYFQTIPEVKKWGMRLEHYIISSGMTEILEGSRIYKYFKRVYACEYEYRKGVAVFPKLVINDTNKTQFLFRINKGKLDLDESINTHMSEDDRRIPFRNLIYVGDSVTDIPSMTVIQKFGGHAIAVFDPSRDIPPMVTSMVRERKVDHFAPADYRPNALLVKILKTTLRKIVHGICYANSSRMSREWVRRHR